MSPCSDRCYAMPTCEVCGLRKKPRGRSAPLAMANGLCDWECPGYDREPYAGHMWPEEKPAPTTPARGESKDAD